MKKWKGKHVDGERAGGGGDVRHEIETGSVASLHQDCGLYGFLVPFFLSYMAPVLCSF